MSSNIEIKLNLFRNIIKIKYVSEMNDSRGLSVGPSSYKSEQIMLIYIYKST